MPASLVDNALGGIEQYGGNNGLKDWIGPYPLFGGILAFMWLEGRIAAFVPDIIADVFFVNQDLMYNTSSPRGATVGQNVLSV